MPFVGGKSVLIDRLMKKTGRGLIALAILAASTTSGRATGIVTTHQFDSYGMRYAGHIIPGVSGDYLFQVHADDSSRFRLSTDAQASNAVQLVLRDGTCCAYDVPYALGYLYLSPLPGAEYVSDQTRFVLVRFKNVSPSDVANLATFITVAGSSSGIHSGQTHVASDGRTVIFTMNQGFTLNEKVTVSLAPQSAAGSGLDSYQYQFVVTGRLPDLPVITARGDNPPDQAKENVLDGDPATTWLDYIVPDGSTNFSWIQYLYPPSGARIVSQYALTSAGDAPEGDPKDWRFYGVDGAGDLVLLDTQTNQTFSSRGQRKVYAINNGIAYQGYRLEITRVNDPSTAVGVQLAELELVERQGSILHEYWMNIPGAAVSDLTGNPNYPANPTVSDQLSTFEVPSLGADNYGTRVRGYVTAPNTGTYYFWIASDDNGELWLSTDDQPANKSLIASVPGWTNSREWNKYAQQRSSGISLTGGRTYYIEALQKQDVGGENLAVGWAKPGQATSAPSEIIPGTVLSPWTNGSAALVTATAKAASPKAANQPTAGLTSKSAVMLNGVSVPSDFPRVVITARGNPSGDYIWLENSDQGGQTYKMILDNQGNPVFYQRGGSWDFKPQKNGLITWATFVGVDKNFNYVRSYSAVNGYGTDMHELQVMEDGSYFLIGDGSSLAVDMSRFVSNGNPSAWVLENVVQQFTAEGDLIFQWRAWDHLDVGSQQPFVDLTSDNFDFPHMNAIDVDEDGHILVSNRSSSECTKIDRDTGEVIWRLGGAQSTLTFVNDPLNGPSGQHSFRSIGHGHYIMFDNGNLHNPSVSRAVEYAVDPVAKTATLVWQFRDTPDKYTLYMGNVQRLTNGNTHINWVLAAYPKAVEVDSNGVKQLELNLTPGWDLYRSWRAPWDGVVPVPYLIAESYPDNVTLIFNKFGDHSVDHYRIYGGTTPAPTTLLAVSKTTLVPLANLANGVVNYFRVTAVSTDGTESDYSNEENVMVNILQPGDDMVQNADFSAGTNSWIWSVAHTGAGTFSVVGGACLLHITSAGTALTDLQLRQAGLKLLQGKQYVLEFDGSSVGGTHALDVKLGQDQSPFGIYGTASPTLRTTRQHFRYVFAMANATDLNARLMFNMGGLARDVMLDNVTLSMAYDSQVPVTLDTLPGGRQVTVDGTSCTTPVTFTWATNSSHSISAASPQLSGDGHARYTFGSWSDGGEQTHAITVPLLGANYTAGFSAQYLLDITNSPSDGGTVTVTPPGPWFDAGQLVSLTAQTNTGYKFLSWTGVDGQSDNTAQVTLNSYRSVSANFGRNVPVLVLRSVSWLTGGGIQFGVTDSAAVATQVMVWGADAPSPSSWQPLGTVTLTAGNGTFTDTNAPSLPLRFYRVTAP